LDSRALIPAHLLRPFDQAPGNRDRGHLAPRDLLALSDSLAVHQREDRDVAQGVDRIDELAPHADQTASARHEPSLALDRRRGLQVGSGERRSQTSRCGVLMEVAWLELDEVNLAAATDAFQVRLRQPRPLPEVRSGVVAEYASFYVCGRGRSSLEPQRFHVM